MDIAELLAFSVKNKASDLHLSAGLPPMIRVDGDVRRINIPALDHKTVHALIYDIMSDKQRRDYEEFLETDFSFEIPGLARFRLANGDLQEALAAAEDAFASHVHFGFGAEQIKEAFVTAVEAALQLGDDRWSDGRPDVGVLNIPGAVAG